MHQQEEGLGRAPLLLSLFFLIQENVVGKFFLKFGQGLEELQVEALKKLETAAVADPSAAALYDNLLVKGIPKVEAADSGSDSPSSDSSGEPDDAGGDSSEADGGAGDDTGGDSGEDAGGDDDGSQDDPDSLGDDLLGADTGGDDKDESDKDEEDKKDEDTKKATECLREMTYAHEEFSETASAVAGSLGEAAKSAFLYLGLTVAPFMLTHLYKGVLAVVIRLIQVASYSFRTVSTFIERKINSFDEIEKDATALLSSAQKMPENKQEEENPLIRSKYTNESTIEKLKIGQGVDFAANIAVLAAFISEFVPQIDKAIQTEISSARKIMLSAQEGTKQLPEKILGDFPTIKSLTPGETKGYVAASDKVQPHRSAQILPGDTVVVAHLPNNGIKDLDSL